MGCKLWVERPTNKAPLQVWAGAVSDPVILAIGARRKSSKVFESIESNF